MPTLFELPVPEVTRAVRGDLVPRAVGAAAEVAAEVVVLAVARPRLRPLAVGVPGAAGWLSV